MGGFSAEVSSDPIEGAFGVIVLQDTHQLDHVLFLEDEIHHFTHVVTLRQSAVASRGICRGASMRLAVRMNAARVTAASV
jgi:hypothetical protein